MSGGPGSIWGNDQYHDPRDPRQPAQQHQQGQDGREQEPEDDSFVPGFGHRGDDGREDYDRGDHGRGGQERGDYGQGDYGQGDHYDDARRGTPSQDRYDDAYGSRAYDNAGYDNAGYGGYDDGAPSWPDGRGTGPGDRGAADGQARDQDWTRAAPGNGNSNWTGDPGWAALAAAGPGACDQYRGPRNNRPRKRATRWAPRILILVVFLALVIGGTVGGLSIYHKYEARYHPADYASAGTGEVTVQVPSGATAFSLAPELLSLHVIASQRAFTNAAEAAPVTTANGTSGLEAGYYQLHYQMKASLAYAALLDPKNLVQTVVTIPEGKRAVDVIAIVAKKTRIPLKNFQAVLKNPAQLGLPSYADGKVEGYLFPATYAIGPHETALQILQAMVQRFTLEADQVNLVSAASAAGLTPTKLIIEASLAQAEGGSVSDYPKIAEVIHNRLAKGMRLQFDSTVLYGLGKYAVSATIKQTHTPGPYNTYLNAGLPAGPISNPGDAAIQGVLHADQGNWLYFLTKPGGKSQFSVDPLSGQ